MGKTGIDELLKAIETVGHLQDAVAAQDRAIAAILTRLVEIEHSFAALNERLEKAGRIGK